jgi:hypothetical protein
MSNFLKKAWKPLPAALVIALALGFSLGGCDSGTNGGGFIAVEGINGPSIAFTGRPLTLSGSVVPANATNRTITWEIANAGTTGASISDGTTLTTTTAGSLTVTATVANGTADAVPYTKDFTITVYDAGNEDDPNPFGDDTIPVIWIMEKNAKAPPYDEVFPYATVLVTITGTTWTATENGRPYNNGTYTRIGAIGAQWTVTGGTALGNVGVAIIDGGPMTVANLTHTFSDMNGTFKKLTRTASLEGTWITSQPFYFFDSYVYLKLEDDVEEGEWISYSSSSNDPYSWEKTAKGTYEKDKNPATAIITHLYNDSGSNWVEWDEVPEAMQNALGGSPEMKMVIHDNKCTGWGAFYVKQP